MALLLVEDDDAIADPLTRALTREGYTVDRVSTAAGALEKIDSSTQLLILDLGLPDRDGLEVAREVRPRGYDFPILILTARSGEVDMVVGLDAGADDYVSKPFRLAELLARVRALLRRRSRNLEAENSPNGTHLTVQDITVDKDAYTAEKAGQALELTNKELILLTILMENAGNVVSREELYRQVWNDTYTESSKKLDMHISWLRKKLGEDIDNPRYIVTVRGVGFRFEEN